MVKRLDFTFASKQLGSWLVLSLLFWSKDPWTLPDTDYPVPDYPYVLIPSVFTQCSVNLNQRESEGSQTNQLLKHLK